MNPQVSTPATQLVTMFLKPSFVMTAQGSGLQVSVTLQTPNDRPKVCNRKRG